MEDKQKNNTPEPLDIPDAAAKADKPVATASPGSAPGHKGPKPGQAKKAPARKPAKKKAALPPQEDELPEWLGRLVDWFADIPKNLKRLGRWLGPKLRALPGKFKGLFGSWYYRIYFPLVALALIGIVVGLHWLNGFAADYETAQPIHVADQVAQMFVEGDYDRLYDLDTAAQTLSGGDRAFYVQSLGEAAAGKQVEWSNAFSSVKDEMRYNVTLDGSRFASFTLVPSGQTTAHGNTLWQLGSVTTNVMLESEVAPTDPNQMPYRVRALPDYTVTVDGRTLTQDDVTRTGIAILPENFLPSGVTAPTLTEYGFTSENTPPQITVTDPSGAQLVVKSESEDIWVCGMQEDIATRDKYSEAVIKMAQRIAKFTTQDVSRSAALENVVTGSPAEEYLRKFNNSWAPSHKSESFENMEVSDFCVLSEDCITCHVKFDYILTSRRKNDYTYPTDYTFCIVRRGDEGKLYNLMFH